MVLYFKPLCDDLLINCGFKCLGQKNDLHCI